MSDQSNTPTPAGADRTTPPVPAAPAGRTVTVGDPVISWNHDEPWVYGGESDNAAFETVSFEMLSGATPVLRCDPTRVAPADTPIPTRDERVSVVKRTRAEMPYGEPGVWQLSLPGVAHPSWHRTKRDATTTGLRRLAILDWHAGREQAGPSAGMDPMEVTTFIDPAGRPGDEFGFLRGYTLNANGSRRRGQFGQRTAYAVWRRLAHATVEVDLGDGIRLVPLVVPPDEEHALPLLPVLTWALAQAAFGCGWPDAGAYQAAHAHRHESCGHLTRCHFADMDQPCQAYECHDKTCWDCQLATPPTQGEEPDRAATAPPTEAIDGAVERADAHPHARFAWVFVSALARWLLVDGHGGHLGTVVRSGEHLDYRWQPMDRAGTALAAPARFRDIAVATVERHAGTGARPVRATPLDPIVWDSAAQRRVEHLLVALGLPREQAATAVSGWVSGGRPGRCGDEASAAGYLATHAYPTRLPAARL